MAKMKLYDVPYEGRAEHPRGMFWDRTETGVRVTKVTGTGEVLFTNEYTGEEWASIYDAMDGKYVAPPVPKPKPEPPPPPDPAPRATGGTPDTEPVKPDAPRARTNAKRTVK